MRIIEAANQNKHIRKLDVGIVTNHGLAHLADLLKENTSLEELAIEETKDHQKYWSDSGRLAFTQMLKHFTQIKKVKVSSSHDREGDEQVKHDTFKEEISFYTQMKKREQEKEKDYHKRQNSCNPEPMFEEILKNFEDKDENKHMPVRKFFDNTFGNILNDALFALQKE